MKSRIVINFITALGITALLAALGYLFLFPAAASDDSPFKAFNYVWYGILFIVALPITGLLVYKLLPVAIAAVFAYKTNHRLCIYPSGEKGKGTLELEIHNIGDGAIVIGSAGFLDRVWVKNNKGESLTDRPIECSLSCMPVRIERGEVGRIEMNVEGVEFERHFTGVYYDIDCSLSDVNNPHSKLLSEGRSKINGAPEGVLRKNVLDKRLQKAFVGKIKRNKKLMILMALFLIFFFGMIVFAALAKHFGIPTSFEFQF